MKISFTGFRNVGHTGIIIGDIAEDKCVCCNCLNMELTNQGRSDLDEFLEVLRQYPNPVKDNFITVQVVQMQTGEFGVPDSAIALNFKELPLNKQNLWIYEKLVRFFTEVSGHTQQDYKVSNDYMESEECRRLLSSPLQLMDVFDGNLKALKSYLKFCHSPEVASLGAGEMASALDEVVCDYLA